MTAWMVITSLTGLAGVLLGAYLENVRTRALLARLYYRHPIANLAAPTSIELHHQFWPEHGMVLNPNVHITPLKEPPSEPMVPNLVANEDPAGGAS